MEKKEGTNFYSVEVDNNTPNDQLPELLHSLEQQTSSNGQRLIKYDGFWLPEMFFRPILSAQKHFKPNNSDIVLATVPKSGTTWLKALTFSIAKRDIYTIDQSPLLTSNPHTLMPFLEFDVYGDGENHDIEHIPSPRIFSTHMPFEILPGSIRESDYCRIIYICRNPLDQFISERQFFLENEIEKDAVAIGLDEALDMYCDGIHGYGPFWDHMLGYWNAHLKNPEKVLFLKYEDLKEDINSNVKKIAEFLGRPFSLEEEEQGLVEEIARLCRFESLKNLEVNKNGYVLGGLLKNSTFFRKGEIGDWTNYITPAMARRVEKVMESKFEGYGLMMRSYKQGQLLEKL